MRGCSRGMLVSSRTGMQAVNKAACERVKASARTMSNVISVCFATVISLVSSPRWYRWNSSSCVQVCACVEPSARKPG